jgi:hypothetical protein
VRVIDVPVVLAKLLLAFYPLGRIKWRCLMFRLTSFGLRESGTCRRQGVRTVGRSEAHSTTAGGGRMNSEIVYRFIC